MTGEVKKTQIDSWYSFTLMLWLDLYLILWRSWLHSAKKSAALFSCNPKKRISLTQGKGIPYWDLGSSLDQCHCSMSYKTEGLSAASAWKALTITHNSYTRAGGQVNHWEKSAMYTEITSNSRPQSHGRKTGLLNQMSVTSHLLLHKLKLVPAIWINAL